MTQVTLDLSAIVNGQPNDANALRTALLALQNTVNAIDSSNVADGSLTDTDLAAPSNGVWRTLAEDKWAAGSGIGAGDYGCHTPGTGLVLSGAAGSWSPVPLDPSKYALTGKTAKLKVRAGFFVAGSPGVTLTFQLYPVSSVGGTTSPVITLGTPVAGSSVVSASGAQQTVESGSFTMPAAGLYVLGLNCSGAWAVNTSASGRLQLLFSHA